MKMVSRSEGWLH